MEARNTLSAVAVAVLLCGAASAAPELKPRETGKAPAVPAAATSTVNRLLEAKKQDSTAKVGASSPHTSRQGVPGTQVVVTPGKHLLDPATSLPRRAEGTKGAVDSGSVAALAIKTPETSTTPAKTAAKNHAITARVFVSGNAARQKGTTPGLSQLSSSETKLVARLGYRDYQLVGSGRKLVPEDTAYSLALDSGKSVSVKPLYEVGGKIRAEITWTEPGGEGWTSKFFVLPGETVLIAGPPVSGGGVYLLSVTVK